MWLLRSRAWLLPAAGALPTVDLAITAGYVGYRIGNELRQLFTQAPVPAAVSAGAGIVKARWLFQGQEIIGIGYPNAPQLIAPTMGLAAADNVGSTLI